MNMTKVIIMLFMLGIVTVNSIQSFRTISTLKQTIIALEATVDHHKSRAAYAEALLDKENDTWRLKKL